MVHCPVRVREHSRITFYKSFVPSCDPKSEKKFFFCNKYVFVYKVGWVPKCQQNLQLFLFFESLFFNRGRENMEKVERYAFLALLELK